MSRCRPWSPVDADDVGAVCRRCPHSESFHVAAEDGRVVCIGAGCIDGPDADTRLPVCPCRTKPRDGYLRDAD